MVFLQISNVVSVEFFESNPLDRLIVVVLQLGQTGLVFVEGGVSILGYYLKEVEVR